jgi:seryl-tRNA synthetase
MDIVEWLQVGTAFASAVAAVLAWAAKIWWGREFSAAKDEIIRAKDAQIEVLNREIDSLRELTPMKLREYFLSMREQLEEYNESLKSKLEEAECELEKKGSAILRLKSEGKKKIEEIRKLESEREQIAEAASSLSKKLSAIKRKYESEETVILRLPKIDHDTVEDIDESYLRLVKALSASSQVDESRVNYLKIHSQLSSQLINLDRCWQIRNDFFKLLPDQGIRVVAGGDHRIGKPNSGDDKIERDIKPECDEDV